MACPFVVYSSKDKTEQMSVKKDIVDVTGNAGAVGHLVNYASPVTLSPAESRRSRRRFGKEIPVTYCWQVRLICGKG